jgi:hypothetical protein
LEKLQVPLETNSLMIRMEKEMGSNRERERGTPMKNSGTT